MSGPRILVVRLGSMGDVVAALPAVASLKHSLPQSRLAWVIEPKWRMLLEGNPYVDSVITFERRTFQDWRKAWRELRAEHFDIAVDFQGLVKSALSATVARPERIFGFTADYAREAAGVVVLFQQSSHSFLSRRGTKSRSGRGSGGNQHTPHFSASGGRSGGRSTRRRFHSGKSVGGLGAKQWPLEYYSELAQALRRDFDLPLVLNTAQPMDVQGVWSHVTGLPGLIHATRRATAVVGIDSGPTHLAAALGKTGVAIYGPTDPARHGPYGDSFTMLRSSTAVTNYRRSAEPDASMRAISPEQVMQALAAKLPAAQKHR